MSRALILTAVAFGFAVADYGLGKFLPMGASTYTEAMGLGLIAFLTFWQRRPAQDSPPTQPE